ncbi:MAG: D-alanyl-D-alanine carboxypeptidase family protein [Nitrosomonadaceae bacterium]
MKHLIVLALCCYTSAVFAQQTGQYSSTPPGLSIAAKAYILTDFQSGQTLASLNIHDRIEPASLTKVMTAHVVFSAIKQKRITPTQNVPVSERAWQTSGSRMFIEPNRPVTVDELIRGMIIQSGNDASIALAEVIAGSEDAFSQMMNNEAQRMGMKNTHFANATGLPHPDHFTTAYDLSLLAAAMIRDFPEHYPIYSTRDYTYNKITQPNRNRLLWLDPHVDGLKSGHTQAAGYCLITSAKRNERRLISVVIGTSSDNMRAMESQRLLNHGFQFYDTVRLYRKGQEVTSIPLWKGSQSMLKAGFGRDLYFTLPRGQNDKMKATMEYQKPLTAPISAGQRVGSVKISIDGKLMSEYPLVALEGVSIGNIFSRTWDSIRLLIN